MIANAILGHGVQAFGTEHILYADSAVSAQYISDTLNLAKVSVFQFAYTEYLITDNWLIYMEDYLRKKGLFKFIIKKKFKEAQRDLRRIIKLVETQSEPDYCNEYANQLYDMSIPAIEKLRDLIAKKLHNFGVKNPGLCSTVIVLQNLICMAVDTFDCIFQRVYDIRHLDIKKCFLPVCPLAAANAVEDMLIAVMGEGRNTYRDNITENKQIKAAFETYARTLYDPHNIEKAQRAAYEAMSDEQKERFELLENGACVLKERVGNAKNS